jgi:hypothetical protein
MNSSTRLSNIRPEFVDTIPRELERGVLYISPRFNTTAHSCACGCGIEVIAPLRPKRYRICYDGEHVTLSPSIGNWNFPCQSHYFVRKNKIEWSWNYSQEQIAWAQRKHDRAVDAEHAKSSRK